MLCTPTYLPADIIKSREAVEVLVQSASVLLNKNQHSNCIAANCRTASRVGLPTAQVDLALQAKVFLQEPESDPEFWKASNGVSPGHLKPVLASTSRHKQSCITIFSLSFLP